MRHAVSCGHVMKGTVNEVFWSDGPRETAEIKSGRRRIIEYVIYPLIKALDETAREP